MTTPDDMENLPSITTTEEDAITAGQCRTMLVWEVTQGIIAVGITAAVIANNIMRIESQVLVNAFFLVAGSYFSRVNFLASGGARRNTNNNQQYRGR